MVCAARARQPSALPPFPSSPSPLPHPPRPPALPLSPARAVFFFCILFSAAQPEGVFFFLRLTGFETSWLYYLEELPSLIILTLFTQQVLGWARSYHVAVGEEARYAGCVLRAAIAGNALVIAAQVALWGAYFGTRGRGVDPDVFSVAAASVHAASFLLCGAAMCAYGVANSAVVRSLSLGLALRLRQLRELTALYAACSAAFVLRAVALAVASWANLYNVNNVRTTVTPGDAVASVVIYVFTELLPLWCILHHHRPRGRLQGAPGVPGAPSPVELRSPYSASPLSPPGQQRAPRFAFSPTRGGKAGKAGKAGASGAAGAAGAAAAAQQPPPPPPPPAGATMGTGNALWMLGAMTLAALGLGGGGGGAPQPPSERQRLLGSAGGRARLGVRSPSSGSSGGGGFGGRGSGRSSRSSSAAGEGEGEGEGEGAAVVLVAAAAGAVAAAAPKEGAAAGLEEEEEEGQAGAALLLPGSPRPLLDMHSKEGAKAAGAAAQM